MNQLEQQDMMLRFSRVRYKHGANSYEYADCAGIGQLIYRDFAGFYLPDDRTAWATYFDVLAWPCELKVFDALLMQHGNTLNLIDHMAIHIGGNWIVSLGERSIGLMCERLNRYESKILKVARYKNDNRT